MALPHEFDKVIGKVTRVTGDVNFIRWSKGELIDYIDEGQREYCEKTFILRSEGPLTTRENSEIYNLPEDCFNVDRLERHDGCVIMKTTSRDILRQFGPRYRISRGSVTHYYQDLDGQKQLRFFPIPVNQVLSDYTDFTGELGVVTGVDKVDLEPIIVDGVQIYDESDPLYIASATPQEFDSEFGVTIDSTLENEDGEDTNSFNYEEGAVTGVLSTEGKFRVWYSRYPREGKLEIDDDQSLYNYVLHKCYEKDGPQQNLELSLLYESKYQERVNREIGRVASGQNATMSVRGVYA